MSTLQIYSRKIHNSDLQRISISYLAPHSSYKGVGGYLIDSRRSPPEQTKQYLSRLFARKKATELNNLDISEDKQKNW